MKIPNGKDSKNITYELQKHKNVEKNIYYGKKEKK